jgi:ArsR family transcriptional regulator, arsenate/arsenite/antimonite-responsive transcriptional repressor
MGATKTDHFTLKQNELAIIAKAMAHPARIAIIEFLLKVDTCICGDIVNELPLAQPTVSQHLKELKSAGLIMGDIEGNSVCYCIDKTNWLKAQKHFNSLFDKFKSKKPNCC